MTIRWKKGGKVAALLFLLAGTSALRAMDWDGLIPLKSTRADVEKKYGQGTSQEPGLSTYQLRDFRVSVTYSLGDCESSSEAVWNVSKDTVLTLFVAPKKTVFLSTLPYNLSRFTKLNGGFDLPATYYYLNEEDGMSMDVDRHAKTRRNIVMALYFFPAAIERNRKCIRSE